MNKNTLKTPKIRFSDYTDEWKPKLIRDISQVVGGGTPSTENPSFWDGEINWFTPTEIGLNKYVTYSKKTITELGLQNSSAKILPIGAILLSTRASIGQKSILKNEACTNQGFQSLIVNGDISNEYLYYYLDRVQKTLLTLGNGSTFKEVSKKSVEDIIIYIPSMREQNKIADFLSLFDQSIENLEEKIKLLELQKKEIMHKIFSQELRFPGCKDEWIEYKIGDICEKVGERNDVSEKLNSYSISNENGFIKQATHFENNRYSSLDKSHYKVVNRGEFAYNPARINVGSIGYQDCEEKVAVSSLYVCVKFRDKVCDKFMFYYFQTNFFESEVIKNTEGSVRQYLFFENFSNISLELPCTSEQEKISQFLNEIDNQIENTKLLVEQRSKLKNGLMQRMFV